MADVEKSQTDKPEFEGEWVRLGDVCEIVNGATPRTGVPENWGGDIKWVTPAELRSEIHTVFDTAKHLTKAGFESASLRMMPAGTILLTTRAPIGKLALAGDEMCCNQGFKCLICPETVNNEWLCRLLKHRVPELQAMGAGATFKELSKRAISDYRICVPPMETQIDIVKKLTKLDEVLANCRTLLSALDDLVKSQFVEIGSELKLTKCHLGDGIEEMHLGPFGSALKNDCFCTQKAASCVVYEQKHAIKKSVSLPFRYIGPEKHDELKRFEVGPGDIILSCRGTIGEVYCLPDNAPLGIIHPSVMMVRAKSKIFDRTYLTYLLASLMSEQSNYAKGSGVKMAIKASELEKMSIIIPPLALQRQFADFVAEVDKLRFDSHSNNKISD